MVGKHGFRALAAASLSIATSTALAQPQPQIEIDFAGLVSTAVPLSPLLSVVVALALAFTGGLMLRRAARGGRLFGWLLLGLAAAASWPAIESAPLVSDAIASVPIQLTTSPSTLLISGDGTYTAQNTSGGAIVLTQVKINNAGLFFIAGGTTCTVGAVLQQLATCVVVVSHMS